MFVNIQWMFLWLLHEAETVEPSLRVPSTYFLVSHRTTIFMPQQNNPPRSQNVEQIKDSYKTSLKSYKTKIKILT